MDKATLQQVILDQQRSQEASLLKRMDSSRLKEAQNLSMVTIISGIRRCGKSTLLGMVREQAEEQSYFVNFDDERLVPFELSDFAQLEALFIELFGKQRHYYFDEIQNIAGWERFVRRLHDEGNKVTVTGSNASMLSKELGTHLTGRYHAIELYPFSFKEYMQYTGKERAEGPHYTTKDRALMQRAFSQFIEDGGFPEYLIMQNADYLKYLYDGILYRDIMVRYKLTNPTYLREVGHYLASNIGKLISFNKIKNIYGIGSATTVKEYIDYFNECYVFFTIHRYDPSLKKQYYGAKKVYMIDTALARTIGFRPSRDEGRMLENAVFVELKRQQKEIYFHQQKKECDFVLKEGTQITEAIQVTHSLSDSKTRTREIEGLIEAMECYKLKKGLILTHDEEGSETVMLGDKQAATITIMPIWRWLLDSPASL